MKWLFWLLTLSIEPYLTRSVGNLVCEQGYGAPQNSEICYRLVATPPYNYGTALAYCRQQGGDLASIHGAMEDAYVNDLTAAKKLIGLRINETTGNYSWSDGSKLDFTNYDDGFTDKWQYFGDCAMHYQGKWQNIDCDMDLVPFVCKRAAVNFTESDPNKCPNSTLYYKDGGVVLSPGYPKNYGINLKCSYQLVAQNGYSIKLFLEDLKLNYSHDYFYVVNEYDTNRMLLTLYPTETPNTWEAILRSNRIRLDFYSSYGGTWKLSWTGLKQTPIKAALADTSHPFFETPDQNYYCQMGYTLHEERCYKRLSIDPKIYYDALTSCRDDGADLVSIHNPHTDQYLQSSVIGSGQALIGLMYTGAKNNSFQWSDGSPVDYTNFAPDFVDMVGYLGYCAKLLGGVWHNAECYDRLPYICEKKAMNYTPTEDNKCPDGSQFYMNSGVLLSPGYPKNHTTLPGYCYYELLVNKKYYIKLQAEELDIPVNYRFNIQYYSSGTYLYSGVTSFYPESEGSEFLIPHNRIRLEYVPGAYGRWRLNFQGIKPNSIDQD